MLKRTLSVVLALAMLLGICPAALAQQVETEGSSWLQTFSELAENTAPEGMRLTGVPALYEGAETLPEEQKNIAVTQGVNGVFGKESDDTAFMVRTMIRRRHTSDDCARHERICRRDAQKRRGR